MGQAVAEKTIAFEKWLQKMRWAEYYNRYRPQREVVKRAVQVVKIMADRRVGE